MSQKDTAATPFDLASLDTVPASDEGSEMTVLHPKTGAPIDNGQGGVLTIRLAGPDSEIYRKAQRAVTNRRLSNRRRNNLTAEALEAEALDLLTECTLSWSAGWVFEGKDMPCNKENARLLYKRLPWLKEQVDEFIGDRANFLKS